MEPAPPLARALGLFIHRLETRSQINAGDRRELLALPMRFREVEARTNLIEVGDEVQHSWLVAEGLLARCTKLDPARVQIVSMNIPGDLVDVLSPMLSRAPFRVLTLTPSAVVQIPHAALRQVAFVRASLSTALWREAAVDASIMAQWLIRLGQLEARARLAHLFCEMAVRFTQAGLFAGNQYVFPVTQSFLANAVGLTPVHVNRSLKKLQKEELLHFHGRQITILNWAGLAALGNFDPAYLY